jgi:hypothetical protein
MPAAKVFGYDLSTINWKLVSYVLVSIAVMVMGVFYSYTPDALARTLLFAIGGSLVFYFFYLRWFGQTEQIPDFWPPTINTCPDYLTYVTIGNSGGCVDYLGVATGGSSNLPKSNPSDRFTSTSDIKVFAKTSTDVRAARDAAAISQICTLCQQKGVTWEGVWDGDTCVGMNRFITTKQLSDNRGCPV